ncbi:hypothetical protein B0H14DRAFT_2208535, partial [Mycena olivaceomarginata]
QFGEILYFIILTVAGEDRYVAVASFFAPPDPYLLEISLHTYWSMKHLRDADVRAIE